MRRPERRSSRTWLGWPGQCVIVASVSELPFAASSSTKRLAIASGVFSPPALKSTSCPDPFPRSTPWPPVPWMMMRNVPIESPPFYSACAGDGAVHDAFAGVDVEGFVVVVVESSDEGLDELGVDAGDVAERFQIVCVG